MKDGTVNDTSGGTSLSTVLFIVFLVLKLTGVINWSWWWITAPLWGGLALSLAGIAVVGVVLGIMALIVFISDAVRETNRHR